MLLRVWLVVTAIPLLYRFCNAIIIISQDAQDSPDVPLKDRKNYDTKLEAQLKVACVRIKLAGDELEKVVGTTRGANPAVMTTAGYLFHAGDYGHVYHRFKWLNQICGGIKRSNIKNERTMDFPGNEYDPAWVEGWKKIRRKKTDIIIYTTGKRFDTDHPDLPPYDLTWHYVLAWNDWGKVFDTETPGLSAYTLEKEAEEQLPDIIQLAPAYLRDVIDDEQPKTCKDLESKAQDVQAMLRKSKKRTADGYKDMPHTLVHELMHTEIGGIALDVKPNPYGWENCTKMKNHRNADSLAFMTTMTSLIVNCGYQPNEDGSISKIKGWKAPS